MKEKKSRLFWSYYIYLIFFALFGLFDSNMALQLDNYGSMGLAYSVVASLLSITTFIFSIIALVMFLRYKFRKLTIVLPIYHIVIALLVFAYSFTWGIMIAFQGGNLAEQAIPPGLVVLGYITSLFELIFAGFVIYKFK